MLLPQPAKGEDHLGVIKGLLVYLLCGYIAILLVAGPIYLAVTVTPVFWFMVPVTMVAAMCPLWWK